MSKPGTRAFASKRSFDDALVQAKLQGYKEHFRTYNQAKKEYVVFAVPIY